MRIKMNVDYVENGFVMLLWFAILARLVLRRHAHALQRRSSSFLAYRVRMMFLICEFAVFFFSHRLQENRITFCSLNAGAAVPLAQRLDGFDLLLFTCLIFFCLLLSTVLPSIDRRNE